MRSCRKPSWNPANPEACRIPGHRKHMVDAERIKAHHMRLRADQVSVTASDVDQRPKSRACLYQMSEGHVAHAGYGQRVICKGQRIGPAFSKLPRLS